MNAAPSALAQGLAQQKLETGRASADAAHAAIAADLDWLRAAAGHFERLARAADAFVIEAAATAAVD